MLIDTHCHLDFPDFANDLPDVMHRAAQARVAGMVSISVTLEKFPGVLAVAESHPHVYCTVGVHPHSAEQEQVAAEQLIALAAHPKVIGLGETGLDYYYDNSPRTLQQANFRAHITAARTTGLPLIIHTRDADADTVAILEEEYAKGPFPGLIHCFTAGRELAERVLAIGFYVSVSGIVTFKKAEDLRQTLRDVVPIDRLLVETDAPYLAPIPHRGARNEPAFVAHTAATLAALKGVTAGEVAAITTANAKAVFHKAKW